MSNLNSGYSFIIESSERLVNKLVRALFEVQEGGVPTIFSHEEQNGLISSRESISGKFTYKKYLLEGMLGYLVELSNPRVRFLVEDPQQIELNIDFTLVIFRRLIVRNTPNPMGIPADPDNIDPEIDYPVTYESDLVPDTHEDKTSGSISIILNLELRPFDDGKRVTIDVTEASMEVVERIEIRGVEWNEKFIDFLEITFAKILTEILKNEVKEIDVTPFFGALEAFGITLRPPIHLRLGYTARDPALAVGLHEWSVIGDGDPAKIRFETAEDDYVLQISEAFFTLLVANLYQGQIIPHRFDLKGKPNLEGPLFLHQFRITFLDGHAHISTILQFEDLVDLFARADLEFQPGEDGLLKSHVFNICLHPHLSGLLGAFQTFFNVLTFYWFDGLVSEVLGELMKGPVNTTIGGTLDDFLERGGRAFSICSPIRNTRLVAELVPYAFAFEPGRALLRGQMDIKRGGN